MPTLERVNLMRKQGIPEDEIIKRLQAERISPKEILDSLEQSKIKSAVSDFNSEEVEGMQPSMMGSSLLEDSGESSDIAPAPLPQQAEEIYRPTQSAPNYQNYYQPQEQVYSQNYYPPQQENYENYAEETQMSSTADTIIEISEQVFLEKTKDMQKQTRSLVEFKTLLEVKIENIEERLKRMEKLFDQMQMSIIDKVSTYGKGLDFLKKEIDMVEDSFSKMVEKSPSEHIKKTSSKKKK